MNTVIYTENAIKLLNKGEQNVVRHLSARRKSVLYILKQKATIFIKGNGML
jgi:hypothetical protein